MNYSDVFNTVYFKPQMSTLPCPTYSGLIPVEFRWTQTGIQCWLVTQPILDFILVSVRSQSSFSLVFWTRMTRIFLNRSKPEFHRNILVSPVAIGTETRLKS